MGARGQARREQARFALARNAMVRLNENYRQAIANKISTSRSSVKTNC
jgi:hypothetical protein